mgnify:CR=1 FL=1
MITADLDQQLHGWSIDAIDNHDGCAVFLQKLEEHTVWDDVAVVAIHPLIIPDGHERGVMVTVGIDDGTRLETAEISRLCNGDFVAFHGVLTFLLELSDLEFALQFVGEEFDHFIEVLHSSVVADPVAGHSSIKDQVETATIMHSVEVGAQSTMSCGR